MHIVGSVVQAAQLHCITLYVLLRTYLYPESPISGTSATDLMKHLKKNAVPSALSSLGPCRTRL